MRRLDLAFLLCVLLCALTAPASFASDHADPIFNTEPDAGLTGLFVFPVAAEPPASADAPQADAEAAGTEADAEGEAGAESVADEADMPEADAPDADREAGADAGIADAGITDAGTAGTDTDPASAAPNDLVLILGIHPALIAPGPYDLEDYQYNIHIDHHSEVSFSDPAERARYGGTVVHPKGISADVTLSFRLDNEAKITDTQVDGLDGDALEIVSGVYDDPFIFPRFFAKNIIAIAVRVPASALPEGRQDFLFWATTTEVKSGDQVDHVGRSNRTQLARLDFLNTVPPSEHVDRIHEVAHRRERVQNFLKRYPPPALWQAYQLLQNIRHYDYVPDVMIFSFRNEPGYPNGRRLADDIVGISCSVGDCILQETAFQESDAFPRITTNDRPFTDTFPYLGAPWPEEKPASQPGCFFPTLIIVLLLGFFAWLFFKIVCTICRRKTES